MKDFNVLIENIQSTHKTTQQSAVKAVNVYLTIRNWLAGFYIVEFEQNGEDRANYGNKLLANLAKSIKIKGLSASELSKCRKFYNLYPQFSNVIAKEYKGLIPKNILGLPTQEFKNEEEKKILRLPTPKLQSIDNQQLSFESEIITTISAKKSFRIL